jgi:hypothetical protein
MSVERAASPMRFIAPFLARVHSRPDEPFIPFDPLAARWYRGHSLRPRPPRRKQSNTVWSMVSRARSVEHGSVVCAPAGRDDAETDVLAYPSASASDVLVPRRLVRVLSRRWWSQSLTVHHAQNLRRCRNEPRRDPAHHRGGERFRRARTSRTAGRGVSSARRERE